MTEEDIIADRAIIEAIPRTIPIRIIDAARTRWPAALDRVEELQMALSSACAAADAVTEDRNRLLVRVEELEHDKDAWRKRSSADTIIVRDVADALTRAGIGFAKSLAARTALLAEENTRLRAALAEACDIAKSLNGDMGDPEAESEDEARIAELRAVIEVKP